jgi:hypothetical protein
MDKESLKCSFTKTINFPFNSSVTNKKGEFSVFQFMREKINDFTDTKKTQKSKKLIYSSG